MKSRLFVCQIVNSGVSDLSVRDVRSPADVSTACVPLLTDCALFLQLMWKLREGITEGLLHDGYVYKYDISLPHSSFYAIIPELRKRLPADKVGRICGYGHVGMFKSGWTLHGILTFVRDQFLASIANFSINLFFPVFLSFFLHILSTSVYLIISLKLT